MSSEHPFWQNIEKDAGKTPQERRSHVVNEYQKANTNFNREIFNIDTDDTDAMTEYTMIRKIP